MNVLLHKKLHLLLLFSVFWLSLGTLSAQQELTVEIVEQDVLMNETYEFAPIHHYSPLWYQIKIVRQAENGTAAFDPYTSTPIFGVGSTGLEPEPNYVQYTPNPGFTGFDEIVVQYQRKKTTYSSEMVLRVFKLRVVPSYLYAENDYAATDEGQSVNIDVLDNDYGNGTNLTVSEITNVNNGTAVNNGGDITFTPSPGFSGVAHLNYTICDAQGSCDMATVSICVTALTPATYDSIHVTTEKNGEQVILMELDSNYSITTAPTLGSVDTFETLTYLPNQNATGTDKIIFTDPINNRTRVFEIDILDVEDDNILLFGEVEFTPQDETIEEIDLLANDNGGEFLSNFTIVGGSGTAAGGSVFELPSVGLGVVQYIPPSGFTGIDHFTYKAKAPGTNYTEYATCYIIVSNQNPELPVFQITSPKNTPLVLGDHLPFLSYEFSEVSAPDHGEVDFYVGEQTVTSLHGQEFTGNNMLVYDPEVDFTGEDEFEINYCAGGQTSNCPLIKIEVEVVDVANPQSTSLCAGPACVWPGDSDKNGKVDIRDILPIGLCMGEVGEDRLNGSVDWYGQYADNWSGLQGRGLPFNVKHIDTDGNGIVSAADTAAIGQFYGKYNNLAPLPSLPVSSLPFYIDTDSFINIEPGAVIYAPIHLGNDSIPAFDAYGLTFEIEFDPALFEAVNVYWNETSWLKYNSPVLSKIVKPFNGKVDAGYTRTSGVTASGYGIIGIAEFIVVDDLSLRINKKITNVTVNRSNLMTSTGECFGLKDNELTFVLSTPEEGESASIVTEEDLVVFPNPAQSNVTVHLNGMHQEMERIALYDVMGKEVFNSGNILAKRQRVDVSSLPVGVYVLKVWSNGEMLNKKVEIVH